ncbi:flavodoxin FldA [Gloeobacter violaceus]|uniref:Flavodoxin n=1 Tax=Gloeobacter violaceus (strain ATCC 29082 / PCC 7421) TaxID=251221 RepID=Q7NNU5_GLOVI|nr:flavodoxin FldA [Gloeobacter violaceus]BAC88255.1 flavodoxin [Gloeobacter violaceus PCC 7421]
MPAKIGLFFGTTTGKTGDAAEVIQQELGKTQVDLRDIGRASKADLTAYEYLIIGCPTWNIGDLQDDWDSFYPDLDQINFAGKKVAYFGTGDQRGYGDNFQDAMGILEEKISQRGGTTVGYWPADNYDFNASKAYKNGKFVGLALDDDNQPEQTERRIKQWVAQLKREFGI